jgi:hypothetical protein
MLLPPREQVGPVSDRRIQRATDMKGHAEPNAPALGLLSAVNVTHLQRAVGNRAVQKIVGSVPLAVQRTSPDAGALALQARSGNYAAVAAAISAAGYIVRDDLSEAVVNQRTVGDLIRIGRTPSGASLLARLRSGRV